MLQSMRKSANITGDYRLEAGLREEGQFHISDLKVDGVCKKTERVAHRVSTRVENMADDRTRQVADLVEKELRDIARWTSFGGRY